MLSIYDIQKIKNKYKTDKIDNSIKHIFNKNDLKYLKKEEENIYFTHNFKEKLEIGDIPENIKLIIFYRYYSIEISNNVLPINLEVLFLGHYDHCINRDIIPKNVWFLSIIEGNIDKLFKEYYYISEYCNIENNLCINNLLLFVNNNDDDESNSFSCISYNKKCKKEQYIEILDYFNIKFLHIYYY